MNIMLFTDIPPCTNRTAGIVLNDMCDFLLEEGHSVCCFYMHAPIEFDIPEDKKLLMNFECVSKPFENWGHTKYGVFSSFINNNFTAKAKLEPIAIKAVEFAKNNGADLIWSVIQGQSMIKLARPIAERAGLRYVIQLWDPQTWWMSVTKCDWITTKVILSELGRVIRDSECFIAASWAMADEYTKRYKCKKSVPVIRSLDAGNITSTRVKNDGNYIIAMSGQMYAAEELRSLIVALRTMNWTLNDKKVRLHLYGHDFELDIKSSDKIELKGWVNQDKLLNELADADLLYCPYWFDKSFEEVARYSFPSKLSTYLTTGVPILFHGPDYSSPYRFLREHNAAYICKSNDITEIIHVLNEIDKDIHSTEIVRNGYNAYCENFTMDLMKSNFYKALNISVKNKERLKMRVLHVNNVDIIGSRFNGHDMQIELNNRGIPAKQAVVEKLGSDKNTLSLTGSEGGNLSALCVDTEKKHSIRALVHPYGWKLMNTREFAQADIVHYHLIHNNILSMAMLPDLLKKKPSVLTLHDAWLFSGHCVHSLGCMKWCDGCGDCPDLSISFGMDRDNTEFMWKIKKNVFSGVELDIVVASEYMMRMVKESPITAHLPNVHHIPFGIETEFFRYSAEKKQARQELGISKDDFVLLFRADPSPFKGLDIIMSMLDELSGKSHITLLTVGQENMLTRYSQDYTIKQFGWITNNSLMAQIYQACDVLLMPSKAESFGLMAVEAMATGRPVIVMDGTALPDITFAPEYGILISNENPHLEMKRAVENLMQNPVECLERGKKGSEIVEENYRYQTYIEKHIQLYKTVINRKREN